MAAPPSLTVPLSCSQTTFKFNRTAVCWINGANFTRENVQVLVTFSGTSGISWNKRSHKVLDANRVEVSLTPKATAMNVAQTDIMADLTITINPNDPPNMTTASNTFLVLAAEDN